MFDNEVRISADKEDLIKCAILSHKNGIFQYYLNLQILTDFEDYLKNAVKLSQQENYLINKYLKNINYKSFKIDLSNENIICYI